MSFLIRKDVSGQLPQWYVGPHYTEAYNFGKRFPTREDAHAEVERLMVGYVGPNPFTIVDPDEAWEEWTSVLATCKNRWQTPDGHQYEHYGTPHPFTCDCEHCEKWRRAGKLLAEYRTRLGMPN